MLGSEIFSNATADITARLGSLSVGNIIVVPNHHICHRYGLINRWVRRKSKGVGEMNLVVMFLGMHGLL